jgi:hypothetical protein
MMTAEQALRQFTAVDDPSIVADVLLDMGITGRPRQYTCCPITEYLGQFCGPDWRSSTEAVWQGQDGWPTPLPPVVSQFIREFDSGLYPMLEG